MSEDLKRRVKEALGRTEIMALSTIGADGPWVSPVQFQYDEYLQLHFLSHRSAKHVQNILRDPRVSVAIYSHPGPPGGNIGLQLSGVAELLNEGSASDGWLSFTVTPREIWCFDSRVFGRDRRRLELSQLPL